MKKTILILLAVGMAFTLVACGGGNTSTENTPSAPSTPSTPSQSTPAATTPVTPAAPAAPTEKLGPEGQTYGGLMRLTVTDPSLPFGLPWTMGNSENTLLAPYAEPLLIESLYGELSPLLAESWEVDAENKEIRFKLKEGVLFTDGSELTAEVAAWQFQNEIAAFSMNTAVIDVEVRGKYEIACILNAFNNTTLTHFAGHVTAFVSKENFDKNGEEYTRDHPIGTGPYVLKDKIIGSSVNFIRNENYWQEGRPFLDEIEYVGLTDVMTQNAAFMSTGSDTLDVLRTSNGEQYAVLSELPNITIEKYQSGIAALAPSSLDEKSPLSKLEIRQAIFYAIDRDTLCEARGFGLAAPAYQVIAPGFTGYLPELDSSVVNGYDPVKSKELMAKAGYPDGFSVTFYNPLAAFGATYDQDTAIAIQKMLEDVGINVTMEFPEAGAATELRTKGWDGLMAHTIGSFTNSSSAFRLNVDPFYQYQPSTWRPVDEILEAFNLSRETPKQEQALLQDLHRLYTDNMVVIPVMFRVNTALIKDNVHDSGFGKVSGVTIWTPWDAWKS